ncbi:MAG TPA: serine/threonine-protein kinase, partial [Nannocystaceae bacterium]|nr:serine/threonine-protein kinase [Nannocystaceae bacterium]
MTRRDPADVATPAAGADEPSAVFDEVHRRLFAERELDVTVGRYRLLHPIGGGGFGCVFRAHDPELDRLVAIKLLRRDRGDDADLLQEARALARFRHPNVVSVFDVGHYDLREAVAAGLDTRLSERGVFVVMELVPGEALSSWLDERRSWRRVLAAFDQAAAGLAAAHAIGLVHRDVKPGNILIEPDGHVRVTDFGLARGVPVEQGDGVAGTPAFMAPEQLDGHADARADQYGLCVALYLALAGHMPFTGDAPEAMRTAKYAGALVTRAAPQGVPRRIWDAVLRGLSPRAEDRFADLHALREAIDPSRSDRR